MTKLFTPRPSQSTILTYTGGTMGIAAVPGAGKTHTLSALASQILKSGALDDNQEVLIVTLVNSAVDNFATRIKEFLASPLPLRFRVRTLHGLAHDIVREKPAAIGLADRFSIIDEREADLIRREAATAWLQTHPGFFNDYFADNIEEGKRTWYMRDRIPDLVSEIALAFIRSAKNNRLSVERLQDVLKEAPGPLPLAVMGLEIYENYQKAVNYRAAVDFDDLIRLAIDLLEVDREYLLRLQYRWPYILEDEAQDSSRLQEQILRLLAGKDGNWVRVGDPNQAIFETFTTASPKYLLKFIHSEANQYRQLPESGRCQLGIIALANQLIRWVNGQHPETAVRDALAVPFIHPAPTGDPQANPPFDARGIKLISKKLSPQEEIEAVVTSLRNWLPANKGATLAILVPRNTRGMEVIDALKNNHIDFIELLGSTFSTRQTANRLSDILSALADPQAPTRLSKAYLAWRLEDDPEGKQEIHRQVASLIGKCRQVESFLYPKPGKDWLKEVEKSIDKDLIEELENFRTCMNRWQAAVILPIDQLIFTISLDMFTKASDLALAHKLALVMDKASDDHCDWKLPELVRELILIARNERKFLGFSEEDSGFDPTQYPGKVVVSTMHKAKGLEWDRVYLMSVNNYDFPSNPVTDNFIAEKFFIREHLNLQAESLAQLDAAIGSDNYRFYEEGNATYTARLDYIRERLRLLYVAITRAKKELIITWNTGRYGNQVIASPLNHLMAWWEENCNNLPQE